MISRLCLHLQVARLTEGRLDLPRRSLVQFEIDSMLWRLQSLQIFGEFVERINRDSRCG
jgi:hypothetical protein